MPISAWLDRKQEFSKQVKALTRNPEVKTMNFPGKTMKPMIPLKETGGFTSKSGICRRNGREKQSAARLRHGNPWLRRRNVWFRR